MTRKFLLLALTGTLLLGMWLPAASAKILQQGLVYPCIRATGAIVVDGDLGDAAWNAATLVSGFRDSGKEIIFPEPMAMQLLWDDQNIYLAVTCYESKMESLVTNVTEHDGPVWDDDCIEIFFDPLHIHADYYQLIVNAKGVRFDSWKHDRLWSKPWAAKTKLYDDRWTVEAAIPLATLGVEKIAPADFWGFNLCRERLASGSRELVNWADVQRNFNTPELFGHLLFVPANWQPEPAALAKIAIQAAGAVNNLLYAPNGIWTITPDGKGQFASYLDQMRTLFQAAPPKAQELRQVFAANPNLPYAKDFAKLNEDFADWQKQAAAKSQLDGVFLSKAILFNELFRNQLNTYYWEVKLAQLNADMP